MPFIGRSANETKASEATHFGYIFGTARYTSQYYYGPGKNDYTFFYIPTVRYVEINSGKIFYGAFSGVDGIGTVKYNGDVDSIPEKAFSSCYNLSTVEFKTQIKSIADNAFYSSKQLKTVKGIDGVEIIGENAFKDCNFLSGIINLERVNSIGASAFCGCKSISSVILSDSLTVLPESLFSDCSSLSSVKGGNSVTVISDNVFSGCSSLVNYLPDTLRSVGNNAYFNCSSLVISNLKSITRMGSSAFAGCNAIIKMTIPGCLTDVASRAFMNCKGLKTVTISEGITAIYASAFSGCVSLETVYIPSSMEAINLTAFSDCNSLSAFVVSNGNLYYKSTEGWLLTIANDALMCPTALITENFEVPASITSFTTQCLNSMSKVKCFTVNEKNMAFAAKDGVLYSADFKILYKCPESYEGVYVSPDTVIKVSEYAFNRCINLTEVNITNRSANIDNKILAGCINVTKLTIPIQKPHALLEYFNLDVNTDSVYSNLSKLKELVVTRTNEITSNDDFAKFNCLTTIVFDCEFSGTVGGKAFMNTWLTKLVLPNGVTSIGTEAFSYTHFRELVLPDTLIEIQSKAFYSCDYNNITLPDSVEFIGEKAFVGCTLPQNFKMPASLKTIDNSAFKNVVFTSVKFNEGLERIGDEAFNYCNIKTVILPNSIKEIGAKAFYGNPITEIILPAGLEKVGGCAFAFCMIENATIKFSKDTFDNMGRGIFEGNKIKSITYPTGIKTIPAAFLKDNPLTELSLPDSVMCVEKEAFSGTDITAVTIGEKIKEIGEYAFKDCHKLTDISFKNQDISLSYMEKGVFAFCTSLKNAFLPENCTAIPEEMYYGCTGITEITIPSTVYDMGLYAFAYSGIKKAYIPTSITKLRGAFCGCKNLEKTIIGEGASEITSESFSSCPKLEKVVIPDTVTEIADDAFKDSPAVTVYCVEKSYAEEYSVQNKIKYTSLSVAPIENQLYTGSEIQPNPTVSMSGKALIKNTDYTVKYKDNINVGTAKMFVRGTGDLSVLTATCQFLITELNIMPAKITYNSSVEYNPNVNTVPEVTIVVNGRTLVKDTDYEISVDTGVNRTVNAGKRVFFITGIKNYSGVINRTYTVTERSISEVIYSFDGEVTLNDGDYTLVSGKDYTCQKTKDGDNVSLLIKGIGNYSGEFTKVEKDEVQGINRIIDMMMSILQKLFAVFSGIFSF